MKLLASLTNRIFIAASLLAIVTTGVAVYVVGLRATREAELELARGLAEAGDLVDQQQRALTAQSLLTARLLADLPKLKGAVETRHAETVAPIAADYRRQVAADLLVISDETAVCWPPCRPARAGRRRARSRRHWAAARSWSFGRTRAACCRWRRCRLPSASRVRTCSAR